MKLRTRRGLPAIAAAVTLLAACGQQQSAPAATPAGQLGDAVPTITMLIPAPSYVPEENAGAQLIAENLKQLGFSVNIVTHPDYGTFVTQVKQVDKWDMGFNAYVPREDRLDPDAILALYLCNESKPGGNGFSGYCSPTYDKLVAEERSTLDPTQRQAKVFAAQEQLARDLPAVTLFDMNLEQAYNSAKYGNVVSVPAVGLWNGFNFLDATPVTADHTYRVGVVAQMPTINPTNVTSGSTQWDIIRMLYDTLTKVGPDGKAVPWAAESWTLDSPTQVTVHLRPGMRFSDGTPVTAGDVAFSYQYLGRWRIPWYSAMLSPVASVEAKDDQTVVFQFKEPYAPFLIITFGGVPIMPQHVWQDVQNPADVQQPHLAASGPWTLVSQQPNQQYVFKANHSHFHAPKSDGIIITYFANKQAQFLALAKGQIYSEEQKGLTTEEVQEIQKDPAQYKDLKVMDLSSIGAWWGQFNLRQGRVFQDYNLRLAVAQAVPYDVLVKTVLQGHGVAGEGVIAPANQFWHDPNVKFPTFDMQKARQTLQQAGFGWDAAGKLHFPKSYTPKALP